MSELSTSEQIKAARNESYDTFTLSNPDTNESRTFGLKHLGYDAYVEFCELARPILQVAASTLDINDAGGEFKLQFNPLAMDWNELIRLAGKELPRMAWLCCKQSDPKITIEKVKELGYRPQNLLMVVLKQIKHNEMVKEFADFFPKLVGQIEELLPAAQEAIQPVQQTTQPTE